MMKDKDYWRNFGWKGIDRDEGDEASCVVYSTLSS